MPGTRNTEYVLHDARALARTGAALAIFLGAFLLFAVEPLVAKMILPWFGGSAAVWIACLLFFQIALLAGYLYAHLLTNYLAAAQAWRVHISLLAFSLLLLPIGPGDYWKPREAAEPLTDILALLAATIGLPFLLLASTGPLLQAWRSRGDDADDPHAVYRFYALSNVGSLLALLAYPAVFEPFLPTRMQSWIWSLAYLVFTALSAVLAWQSRTLPAAPSEGAQVPNDRPNPFNGVLWFALAAIPSALLLAVTHHMLQNIAAIPLLWVIPLALYLLSFIVSFDSPRWFYRPLWYGILPAAVGTLILSIAAPVLFANYATQLAVYATAFFICCMVCHGELAALKPAPRHLTSYYLKIAGGGAAGGLAIAVLAPALFSHDRDLPFVLLALVALIAVTAWRLRNVAPWIRWNTVALGAGTWAMIFAVLTIPFRATGSDRLFAARNFYGPLQVISTPTNTPKGALIELRNGSIIHGRQFTAGETCEPLSYYARISGIGAAIRGLREDGPLLIGVIGLGAGTIAAYGHRGDVFRFYEINPLVRTVAMEQFHYLRCAEDWSVAMGDARLSLERETPANYDVLAVDAFTSDAIPVHLLTREAFALYWQHLKPDGVLAVHVSNTFVNLAPIVALAAKESGKTARAIFTPADLANGVSESVWVLVSTRAGFFENPALSESTPVGMVGNERVWTDDYSNIWRALK